MQKQDMCLLNTDAPGDNKAKIQLKLVNSNSLNSSFFAGPDFFPL